MNVECAFFGPFRDAVGRKTIHHETDAETVGELLRELEDAYPALEGELLDEDETGLVGDTVVTADERNVTHIDGLETEIDAATVVRLVPSVYGG
ncbi:MoaD family protein [Salinadaptatus halalkaliphilus]|uniref:MoaD family protein n=1 Tax=Salinadaptatus halalkaliphilus TaxID=2419781 RepID=A0A4S3TM31_9EURY|nr:ubiquitin-like small modifier protein 1 [Salinadaptatus halalkaliphilus]THE63678.1 MoaD family protein [Salinadaptatus halalkaliphilus]